VQKAKLLSFWLNLALGGKSSFEQIDEEEKWQGEGSKGENIEMISKKSDGDTYGRRFASTILPVAPASLCSLPSSPCFFLDFHSDCASAGYFTKTLGVRTPTNQNQSSLRTLCLLSHQGFVNKIVGKFVNHDLTEGY
jgi:hypothetical protein